MSRPCKTPLLNTHPVTMARIRRVSPHDEAHNSGTCRVMMNRRLGTDSQLSASLLTVKPYKLAHQLCQSPYCSRPMRQITGPG